MAGCTPAQPFGHPTSIPSIWLSGTGRAPDLSLSWQDPWTSLQIVLGVQLALHIPTAISNNLNEHEATCAMWIILNLPTGSALIWSYCCYHLYALSSFWNLEVISQTPSTSRLSPYLAATPRKFNSCPSPSMKICCFLTASPRRVSNTPSQIPNSVMLLE